MCDSSGVTSHYEFPYPSAQARFEHPFDRLDFTRRTPREMHERAVAFRAEMDRRRSVRMPSDEPVPQELIELAVATASTAPSGAHQQPWQFVATCDARLKRQIRVAAEAEERTNYGADSDRGRMNEEWQRELAPLGTDWHKEFLEVAPWVVVLFEERYGVRADGSRRHHYYVKESCGIAAGMFVTALHHMGLATLTHTPSPMAFLMKLFARPATARRDQASPPVGVHRGERSPIVYAPPPMCQTVRREHDNRRLHDRQLSSARRPPERTTWAPDC